MKNAFRILLKLFCLLAIVTVVVGVDVAVAQGKARIAVKSGESVDLGLVYFIANCRSIVLGVPEVEMLDGPDEVTLSIREGMVVPRTYNCAKPIAGGTLVLKAGEIKEPSESVLTYRVRYKTRDGERQRSGAFNLSLFP